MEQSLKLAVVESFIKILMSEKHDCPQDLLCAMMLQYFERPDSEKNAQGKNKAVYPGQQAGIKRVQQLLDHFFSQYVKLDVTRAEEVFKGAVYAVLFLIRAKIDF